MGAESRGSFDALQLADALERAALSHAECRGSSLLIGHFLALCNVCIDAENRS